MINAFQVLYKVHIR